MATLDYIKNNSDYESCDRFRMINTKTKEIISEGDQVVPQGKYTYQFNWDGLEPEDFPWLDGVVPEWQNGSHYIDVDDKGDYRWGDSTDSLWRKFQWFLVRFQLRYLGGWEIFVSPDKLWKEI